MEEAIMDVRRGDITGDSAENVKAWAGAIKVKLNIACMLLELPDRIQLAQDEIETRQDKVAAMKSVQEGGSI